MQENSLQPGSLGFWARSICLGDCFDNFFEIFYFAQKVTRYYEGESLESIMNTNAKVHKGPSENALSEFIMDGEPIRPDEVVLLASRGPTVLSYPCYIGLGVKNHSDGTSTRVGLVRIRSDDRYCGPLINCEKTTLQWRYVRLV
jgi:hypothetical protein